MHDKEAMWRLLGYDLHSKTPSVERLAVHLPNMNLVVYHPRAKLTSLVSSDYNQRTTLTEWFVANQKYPQANELTYCDFPTKWTWHASDRYWDSKGERINQVGRMYNVHPSQGETYYLRMLLMVVKGAKSYEDVRTVNGVLYNTFKEACSARGLLGDDKEWYSAFQEADQWGSASQLRSLFVMMVIYCGVSDEGSLFERCWKAMADDIQYVLLNEWFTYL